MKEEGLFDAFILHRRPFRETSFLVECFTEAHGRLSVVAKGVRKLKSQSAGLLQAFTPLIISWAGKSELKTLISIEAGAKACLLTGDCLFAGFYLNELIMALLQKWDPHPKLYHDYKDTLMLLQAESLNEKYLRRFEKNLLKELGYGLFPSVQHIEPDQYYRFTLEQGLVKSEMTGGNEGNNIFSGKELHAYSKEDWQDDTCLKAAKKLNRLLLTPLLGNRPLHSRRLFIKAE